MSMLAAGDTVEFIDNNGIENTGVLNKFDQVTDQVDILGDDGQHFNGFSVSITMVYPVTYCETDPLMQREWVFE